MKSLILIACISISIMSKSQTNFPTIGKVIQLDPRLEILLAKDAKIEVVASGFVWSEGPIWIKDSENSYLLFSDVPQNTVFKWNEKDGLSTFLKPSGYTGIGPYSHEPGSNGLTLDRHGRLISCEHGDRRISAMPLNGGGKVTLADNYKGKRFNSPNDVVVHSSGAVYFTDPPYGLAQLEKDPSREIDWFGVYRIANDGNVALLTKELTRPNGLAFSPDEKILYVAQSDPDRAIIMAYPVLSDGMIGAGKVFFDATNFVKQGLQGLPDGLKIDNKGNLWATGPGGVSIITPDGTLLGRIEVGESIANCAWGDDGSTLYMTADMYLCRVKTKIKGDKW